MESNILPPETFNELKTITQGYSEAKREKFFSLFMIALCDNKGDLYASFAVKSAINDSTICEAFYSLIHKFEELKSNNQAQVIQRTNITNNMPAAVASIAELKKSCLNQVCELLSIKDTTLMEHYQTLKNLFLTFSSNYGANLSKQYKQLIELY